MKKKWMIFVVFHKNLIDEHYTVDPSFSHEYFTFVKCNEAYPAEFNSFFGYKVIYEKDFTFYDERLQKRTYHAPSVIYHMYKNNIHKKYDYIGFLEYDIPLRSKDKRIPTRLTDHLNQLARNNSHLVIPFSEQHSLAHLWSQDHIIMNGKNAMSQIVEDYNLFFRTNHNIDNLSTLDELIGAQQSFFVDRKTFDHFMPFLVHVVEDRLAERPRSWRRPSTLMERYLALSVFFEGYTHHLFLEHLNLRQWDYD